MVLPQNLLFLFSSCLLWPLDLTSFKTENRLVWYVSARKQHISFGSAGALTSTLCRHKRHLRCLIFFLFSPSQVYPQLDRGTNSCHMLPSVVLVAPWRREGYPARAAPCPPTHQKPDKQMQSTILILFWVFIIFISVLVNPPAAEQWAVGTPHSAQSCRSIGHPSTRTLVPGGLGWQCLQGSSARSMIKALLLPQ